MDPVKLEDRDLHIILYTKGHYPRNDTMKDLKIIFGYFAWLEPKYIPNQDIIPLIARLYQNTYLQYYPWLGLDGMFRDIFHSFFKNNESTNITELVQKMLSGFAAIEVKDLPAIKDMKKDQVLWNLLKENGETLTVFHNYK